MDPIFTHSWLFEGISQRVKQEIYTQGELLETTPNETLIQKGLANDHLFLVLDGKLKAQLTGSQQDNLGITVARREAGDMHGSLPGKPFQRAPGAPAVQVPDAQQFVGFQRLRRDQDAFCRVEPEPGDEALDPIRRITQSEGRCGHADLHALDAAAEITAQAEFHAAAVGAAVHGRQFRNRQCSKPVGDALDAAASTSLQSVGRSILELTTSRPSGRPTGH